MRAPIISTGVVARGFREQGKLLMALGSALALLAAGFGMSIYNDQLYKTQKSSEVGVQAQILAATVTAALVFDDKASAQEYVNALRRNPEIAAVGVYDSRGKLAAGFPGAAELPGRGEVFAPRFSGNRLIIGAPVVQDGATLGSVYLRVVTEPLSRRLLRYAWIMVLVAFAALVVTVLGLAQAALTRAHREQQRRADDLAEANHLLQVQIEEREKAEEALRQSQKMLAIGRITGGVAHDFNNLLMVASSGLDLLDRNKNPARREALKDGIRNALDRAADLTRQLLAFSRRTPLKTEVVDLRRHIEGMQMLLDRSLREDITVVRLVAADLWPVEIDSSQFEIALLNIAVNARDAMPSGGTITVTAQNVAGFDEEGLTGDFVRLSVTDQGQGISPDALAHVFEPFFTTKGVGKGTGLGLSQVYGFAQSSGGAARISSAPGQGTTVNLYIPRTTKTPPPPPAVAEDRRPCAIAGGRILLVEDDHGVAAMVGQMLEELGYRSTRAANAEAALSALETDSQFDMVFSDLVMPGGMDGIELAREIKRRRPRLPILLTTGFSEAAAAAAQDGLRLLPKPYGIGTLAQALEDTLAERA